MKHPTSRQLFAYWDELRGERASPARSDVDPGAIRHILADSFMLDCETAAHAVFESAGTRCCALFGRELRDTAFPDLWADHSLGDMQRMLDTVLAEALGIATGLRGLSERGEPVDLEMILLPVRSRYRGSPGVIGSIAPVSPVDWSGPSVVACLDLVSSRIIRPARDRDHPERASEPLLAPRDRFVVYEGGLA